MNKDLLQGSDFRDPDDPFTSDPEIRKAIEEIPPSGRIPLPAGLAAALEETRREALVTASADRPGPAATRRTPWRLVFGLAATIALGLVVFRSVSPTAPPQAGATARVIITSPGDLVAEIRPSIAWTSKDRSRQRYDVWILPAEGNALEVPALFEAKDVVSPVAFGDLSAVAGETSLAPGRGYRVLVCLAGAGRMAGTPIPFRVSDSAPRP